MIVKLLHTGTDENAHTAPITGNRSASAMMPKLEPEGERGPRGIVLAKLNIVPQSTTTRKETTINGNSGFKGLASGEKSTRA